MQIVLVVRANSAAIIHKLTHVVLTGVSCWPKICLPSMRMEIEPSALARLSLLKLEAKRPCWEWWDYGGGDQIHSGASQARQEC